MVKCLSRIYQNHLQFQVKAYSTFYCIIKTILQLVWNKHECRSIAIFVIKCLQNLKNEWNAEIQILFYTYQQFFKKRSLSICIQNEKALESFEKSTWKHMFTVNKEICSKYCHDYGVLSKFKKQFSAFKLRVKHFGV